MSLWLDFLFIISIIEFFIIAVPNLVKFIVVGAVLFVNFWVLKGAGVNSKILFRDIAKQFGLFKVVFIAAFSILLIIPTVCFIISIINFIFMKDSGLALWLILIPLAALVIQYVFFVKRLPSFFAGFAQPKSSVKSFKAEFKKSKKKK
jgi:hypothetical protein